MANDLIRVEINRGSEVGQYLVRIDSPAGEASIGITLDAHRLNSSRELVQQVLLASSVPGRRILSRGESLIREIGSELFDVLFNSVLTAPLYRTSCTISEQAGSTLRVALTVGASELTVLPWEALYDARMDSYVCRREPLVRSMAVPTSPPPLRVQLPLKVLVVAAAPRGMAALDVAREKSLLESSVAQLEHKGIVQVDWVENATWTKVHRKLLEGPRHILHFIGHSDFDEGAGEAVLALEQDDGGLHKVSAQSFIDLIREARPMPRLVVLNSCQSGASAIDDVFSSFASILARGGAPAVVAMQYEISDRAAVEFSRGFYSALARGRPVDEAVRSGRISILGLPGNPLEWLTPILYLRSTQTQLFDMPTSAVEHGDSVLAMGRDAFAEQESVAEAAIASGDHQTAVPILDSLLAQDEGNDRVTALRDACDPDSACEQDVLETRSEGGRHRRDEVARDASLRLTGERTSAPQSEETHVRPNGETGADVPLADKITRVLSETKNDGGWVPHRGDLDPVIEILPKESDVVATRRVALSLFVATALVVTTTHVYIGTEVGTNKRWVALISDLPVQYKVRPGVIAIPRDLVSATNDGTTFVLHVAGSSSPLTFRTMWNDSNVNAKLVEILAS